MTAPGHVMRCDKAGCFAVATVDQDAWSFCADHAGSPAPKPPARPKPVVDLDQVTPQEARHGIRPTEPPPPSPLGLLLEQAGVHSVAKVRRLAERIETQLDDLRGLVAEHAADEQRRQAEATAKAAARAEVERLEAQLVAAKAKLRGPVKTKAAAPAVRVVDGVATGPNLCTTCSGPITRPAGTRGSWATRCATCKAGAA